MKGMKNINVPLTEEEYRIINSSKGKKTWHKVFTDIPKMLECFRITKKLIITAPVFSEATNMEEFEKTYTAWLKELSEGLFPEVY